MRNYPTLSVTSTIKSSHANKFKKLFFTPVASRDADIIQNQFPI